MRASLRSLTFLIALGSGAIAGDVYVVDINGTGFTQIQSGVDVASDGDVVLVKSGIYASFVVPNKGIAIVADTGADVRILGAIRARHLAVGKTLLLANLRAEGAYVDSEIERRGLFLVDMHGRVRVQDCTLLGASTLPCATASTLHGWDAAHVERCADVAFLDCTVNGGRGGTWGFVGQAGSSGAGIIAVNSTITMHGCSVSGGSGQACCEGAHGGIGIGLGEASNLYALDSAIAGGSGGTAGNCPPCAFGGDGRSGIYLAELSTAWLAQTPVQGGYGGAGYGGFGCSQPDGWDAPAISAMAGSVVHELPWTPRALAAPTVTRAGTPVIFGFTGEIRERVGLFLCSSVGFQLVPAWQGILQVDCPEPWRLMLAGSILGPGTLQLPVDVPLPAGEQARVLHAQALYTDTFPPPWRTRLSHGRSVVVVDPAF